MGVKQDEVEEMIAEHGQPFRDYLEIQGSPFGCDVNHFLEMWHGTWESGAQFAEEISGVTDTEWPMNHINWSAAWHELYLDGWRITEAGNVFSP